MQRDWSSDVCSSDLKTYQKIIFIGDSITEDWLVTADRWPGDEWASLSQEYGNKITNLGFGGDSTQHVIWRLEKGEFPAGVNPQYVVLMIGSNNQSDSPESTAAGIGKICKIIHENSPYTKILLFSLLPRGENGSNLTLKNNAVNEIIKKYNGFWKIQYIDIVPLFLNENGTLKEELYRDRVHPSLAGYRVWRKKLKTLVW
jgi:lysophospholipase L1-like esterase